MTSIVRLALETPGKDPWQHIAALAAAWADERDIPMHDAVVLLPYVQLLPLAQRAFAGRGGWMPRIETTRTLATALGPPPSVPVGQMSFDRTLDTLSAAALMRSQAWGSSWAQRDPRGFQQAVDAMVETAHQLALAGAAHAPATRLAYWETARDVLTPLSGPGATERLLARVALEWASLAPAPATDALFNAPVPSAWIVVQAGGLDPLIATLLAQGNTPSLLIDTDPPDDAPFAQAHCAPTLAVCDSFEAEAQAAAAQVLVHVHRGDKPVALIAQDRVLVRRIRALLERHALKLLDETGWKLSTTRAAALVMGLLQAARPDASTDALFGWLKAGTDDAAALDALEAVCRRRQIGRVAGLSRTSLDPPADGLWRRVAPVLAGLGSARRQPLANWLAALTAALDASGALAVLQTDDAGDMVLAELHLGRHASRAGAWAAGASQTAMSAAEFRRWVDDVLERATYRPTPRFEGAPEVVVTPLAQALLRPFAAVVLPGADDKHLGGAAKAIRLMAEVQAAALGLRTAAHRRQGELIAFGQLLAAPGLTLLRRRLDAGEPLADSPLVERLAIALGARGLSMKAWSDPRDMVSILPAPIWMSAPAAPALLPGRLSASACEALRACPYRFFALYVLRLREVDELDREVEKRDYGTWLHAVLYEFHRTRQAPGPAEVEIERLASLALASQAAQGLPDADFLPFAASFENFAPRYIAWLHRRDIAGARWLSGEEEVNLPLEGLEGIELHGIIDRIDARGEGPDVELELIDYKTGSASSLKEKVREPLEDTQLAFYAALMRPRGTPRLTARYLALDGRKGLEEVEHPEVAQSADALALGLSHDLRRLRAGAGLPALGTGSTCDHCAARGICRRDHWDTP